MSINYKSIIFRADSSSTIGTGHIMRDLVLAKKYKDADIIFATQKLEGAINHKIQEAGYRVELLNSNDVEEFIAVVKKYNAELVVIDSYAIEHKYEQRLKEQTGVKILAFDDTYEKHHCDILLNHNIYAQKERYKELVPKECELQCGAKYTLLRSEFIKEQRKKSIFVAIGGTDHSNINIKILKQLKKLQHIKVDLVTTTSNQNLAQLKEYVKDKKWIRVHIDSTHLAKLMKRADLAIVTPSVTLNEIAFMQIPFIAIKTAKNQEYMYKYLRKNGQSCMKSFSKRKLLFYTQLKLQNLEFKNFTTLSNIEKRVVHTLRNDKRVREWMYTQEVIPYKEHCNYIKSLKKRDDRVYFLVQKMGRYIGVVDFTAISKTTNEAELGIYANPDLKAQGDILMQTILSYGFNVLKLKKIKADVFRNNLPAIKLYKKFGFIVKREDNDLLYMELER